MPVAADRDVRRGPIPTDAADEPRQKPSCRDTVVPATGRGVVMDRQKTALVVMALKK
jgi:hypothetical protein